MNCSQVKDLLEEYFEGTLVTPRQELVASHLEQCPSCAAELVQIGKVAAALSAVPFAEPSVALARAISERAAALPAPSGSRLLRIGWRRLGALATACVAVLTGVRYALPLLQPSAASAQTAAVLWLKNAVSAVGVWLGVLIDLLRPLLSAGPETLRAAESASLEILPLVGLYALAEIGMIAAIVLVARWSRRQAEERLVGRIQGGF